MTSRPDSDALEDAGGLDPIGEIDRGIFSSKEHEMKRSYALAPKTVALVEALAFARGTSLSRIIDEVIRDHYSRLSPDQRREVDTVLAIGGQGKASASQ